MNKTYVDKRDQGYWVAGTRVSLDSIVFGFLDGLSPEAIATDCFPTLSLEQVYGSIAYYLANRTEIDAYLHKADREFEVLRQATRNADPEFHNKLIQARQLQATHV